MNLKHFLLVLAAQTALLLALIAQQEYRLAAPTTVLLETAPVDPRDLLRGDYVILNYKVSTLTNGLWDAAPAGKWSPGLPVFVSLEQRGQFHEAVLLSATRPEPQPNRVLIQGHVQPSWNTNQVRVEYGLERYYVEEGTGNPRGKLTVQVAVGAEGKPVIKQVFIDGKPYAEAMRQQMKP
ncbi:MAG: hypothetical protein RL514_4545 [Verrucomicrobiota bacterium]|jgi:uncharacterized membrane-anchored protein